MVQVKFTDTQRATLTAFAFIDGIFGSTVDVNLPQPLPADPLLKVRILIITKQGFVHFYIILYYTRHIRKVRAVSLYLNIGGSEQSCTHAAPSIECLRSH